MNNELTKKKLQYAVDQLDLQGNVIKTFDSIKEAKEYMKNQGSIANNIDKVLANNRTKSGGFGWKYHKDHN